MRRPDTGRSTAFLSRLSNSVHSEVAERYPAGNQPAITNDTYLCGSECSAAGQPRRALGATQVSIVCDGRRPAGQGGRSKSVFFCTIWRSFAAVRFFNSIGDDQILSDMHIASLMCRGWFDVDRADFLSKGLVSRKKCFCVRGLVGDDFVVKTCRTNMNQSVHECPPVGGTRAFTCGRAAGQATETNKKRFGSLYTTSSRWAVPAHSCVDASQEQLRKLENTFWTLAYSIIQRGGSCAFTCGTCSVEVAKKHWN